MERNRRPSFKKRPNPQFKKGGNKRGKFGEKSSESSQSSETVYRILCQSKKIGSVIGKGGGIIKVLREETQAKITVAESVPGSEERVIIISSPSTKLPVKNNTGDNNENDDMELHCAAQDALLKVHDRIIEDELKLGGTVNGDGKDKMVTARMLVPNNTVGCILGKKGDVIQRLRSETGANIRVLSADQLPACGMTTDELMQISATPAVAKRALYQVSTLLHQNPRKDKPPSSFPTIGSFPPGPPFNNMPPTNLMQPNHFSNAPPMQWPSNFGPNGFNGDRAGPHGGGATTEFSMKILCSAAKIGGVIGKEGSHVRQLQQDTGTNIHVGDAPVESAERVICVSSYESLWNPRSQTIDAVLFLQDKTCDYNESGVITTRILIPSSKVGCIIGQGGQVINEMRKRTKADIRVYSKEEKPKCAGEDEELVQVSGSYGVAKEVLGEIASRFRVRCLRDAKPGEGPSPSGVVQGGQSGGYEPFKVGGRGYVPHSYPAPPVPPYVSGYPGGVNVNMPDSGQVPGMGPGVHNPISQVTGTRPKLQDPYGVCAVAVGGSLQEYGGGAGGQNRPLEVSYPNNNNNYGSQQPPFNSSSSHTSHHTIATTTTTSNPPYYPPQQPPPPPPPPHYPQTSYQQQQQQQQQQQGP